MRSSTRRRVLACLALPLALLFALPATAEAVGPEAPAPDGGVERPRTGSPLADALVEAVERGAAEPAEILEELSLPASGGGSLSFDAGGRVTVAVTFDSSAREAVLDRLAEISEVEETPVFMPVATVRIDPQRLSDAVGIPGVLGVVPTLQPFTGRDLGVRAGTPARALPQVTAPLDTAAACGPVPVEADAPLRSAEAREAFGVDGSGVTVGIMSDSFAQTEWPASWADDVAAGALPGPGNPCGRTQPIEIISDTTGGSDEGRAMAQLVHGIAPGADLMFADAGTSDIAAAENIVALAEAGADIIVDDITWPQEAYFQKSFMSAAIDYVQRTHGVAYFTSAGNANGVGSQGASSGAPVASWQTSHYRPMACPSWVAVDAGADCLDFDPGLAEVAYDTLLVDAESGGAASLRVLASIGEPVFGVTTAYEVRFYRDNPGDAAPQLLAGIASLGTIYPGLSGGVEVAPGDRVRMVMVRTQHDASAPDPAVYLGFVRGGDVIAERRFLGDGELGANATDRVGATVFGHGGDGSAVSVAAADWADPAELREYSSLGPGTQLFDPLVLPVLEAVPAGPLPAPLLVDAPHVVAVDGTRTTFFGYDSGSGSTPEYRFAGTSAAAPNAAAVLALGASYAPATSGAELVDRLLDTARGPGDGGPGNPYASSGVPDAHAIGAGLVDAYRFLEALPEPPPTPTGLSATEITQDSAALRWDAGSALPLRLEVRDVQTGEEVLAEDLAPSTSTRTVVGLVPNRSYTVSLESFDGAVRSRAASARFITLPSAPSGLSAVRIDEHGFELRWEQEGTLARYLLSIATEGSSDSSTPSPSAAGAPHETRDPIELPAETTSHRVSGLSPATGHVIVLEALNADGEGAAAQLVVRTLAGEPDPGAPGALAALPATGGPSSTPVLLGAGASTLLGALCAGMALLRRRETERRETARLA